jgi:hypothetical protein
MGRLTAEKEKSILTTYRKLKSYDEAAKVEDVDPRTVRRVFLELSPRKRRAEALRKQKVLESRETDKGQTRSRAGYVDEPVSTNGSEILPPREISLSSKDYVAVDSAAHEQKGRERQRPASITQLEPMLMDFYETEGRGPIAAVIDKKVPAKIAEQVYRRYLGFKGLQGAIQLYEKVGGDAAKMERTSAIEAVVSRDGLDGDEISLVLNEAGNIATLRKKYAILKRERDNMEMEKAGMALEKRLLSEKVEGYGKTLKWYEDRIASIDNELEERRKQCKEQMEQIEQRKNDAEVQVKRLLQDENIAKLNRALAGRLHADNILGIAFQSIFEAVTNDPDNAIAVTAMTSGWYPHHLPLGIQIDIEEIKKRAIEGKRRIYNHFLGKFFVEVAQKGGMS